MSDLLKFAKTMAATSGSLTENCGSGIVIDASTTLESIRESYSDILSAYDALTETAKEAPDTDSHTINNKTEKWLHDAHEFIEEASNERNKKFNSAQCKLLISIGIGLINLGVFNAAGVIGIILLIGQLIMLFMGLSDHQKSADIADDVNRFERKLDAAKSKAKDKKTQDEIEKLILKIQAKKKTTLGFYKTDDKK